MKASELEKETKIDRIRLDTALDKIRTVEAFPVKAQKPSFGERRQDWLKGAAIKNFTLKK
ncbi:MAG: hypothetical protein WCA95_11555 [Opitutaceae bacterium]